MIPPGALASGLQKTLQATLAALEVRLTQQQAAKSGLTWVYHRGVPDAKSLPVDPISVWLAPMSAVQNHEYETFASTVFIVTWGVHIVVQDTGRDLAGYDVARAIDALAAVEKMLTDENSDSTLDASVEFTQENDWAFEIGSVSGQNRRVGMWRIRLQTVNPILQRDQDA